MNYMTIARRENLKRFPFLTTGIRFHCHEIETHREKFKRQLNKKKSMSEKKYSAKVKATVAIEAIEGEENTSEKSSINKSM